jgi:hypothetical protein
MQQLAQMRSAAALLGVALVAPGLAEAQWVPEKTRIAEVPAPRGAFELGASASFTQPFGEILAGKSIDALVDFGGAVEVELGYRWSPHVSVETALLFHESSGADRLGVGNAFHGTTATVALLYHFLPYDAIDPYVSAGAGYRVLVAELRGANNDETYHGPQALRVLVGLGFRTSHDAELGPFLGADVNAFLWRADEATGEHASIEGAGANCFLYAGFGVRFDFGGERELHGQRVVLATARQ